MHTISPDLAKRHRLSLELAIRALQEQARLLSRYHADFPDAEKVHLLISEAAFKLGLASDHLRVYCPDSILYAQPLTARVLKKVASFFRRGS